MKLRPYQQQALDNVFALWPQNQSVILTMFTGGGKTVLFSHIIKRFLDENPNKHVMVLAERSKLIKQAHKTIGKITGRRVDIEMASHHVDMNSFLKPDIVVGTVQTQGRGGDGLGRIGKFNPMDFGLVIVDECFVQDTMIDGVPIQDIKVGDVVRTHQGVGTVQHVFRKPTSHLVHVETEDGMSFTCTPNHPVWTQFGWVKSSLLTSEHVLASIMPTREDYHEVKDVRSLWNGIRSEVMEPEHGSDVFTRMQTCSDGSKAQDNSARMLDMRCAYCAEGSTTCPCEERSRCVLKSVSGAVVAKDYASHAGAARWRDYSLPQDERDVSSRSSRLGVNETTCDAVETTCSQGEWSRTNDSRDCACGCAGMVMQRGCTDAHGKRLGVSDVLQNRCRGTASKNCHRNRWLLPYGTCTQETGCKEGRIFGSSRVERVTILEQGDSGEFDRLCPDGHVYNLEVSNGNTYFANGILVHNCHHSVAAQYRRILDYYKTNPDVRILGVTATPDRSDKKALGQVFDAVACDYDIRFGYEEGWLMYPHQQFVRINSLDISHVGKVAGDFNAGELADELEKDKPQYEVAKACVDLCGSHKTIVFAVRVSQADALCDIINTLKPNSARFVHGGTPEDERDQLFKDFAHNRFQYLVNVGITVEGFDDPGVSRIVDAAMTMSRAKYTQKLGRMLRPSESIAHELNDCADADARKALIAASDKTQCIYIDLCGVTSRHKPIFLGDILGGDYSEPVRAKARKKAEAAGDRGECVDMDDLLRKAQAEEDIAKARAAARRAKLSVRAEYSTSDVDPFNIYDIKRVANPPTSSTGKRLTDKQKAILDRNGIKGYEDMNIADARKLIDRIIYGYKNDLPTLKMTAMLKRFGYNYPMKRGEAKRVLDAEYSKRRGG